jgi:hypothetical protein
MESLGTTVAGYSTLLISAAGTETDLAGATGYTVGIPDPGGTLGPINLRRLKTSDNEGTGVNAPVLTCYATASDDDDVTMSLYGIREGGAPEFVTSLLWTFGQAIRSSGVRWADSCVATFTSSKTDFVTVEDNANNRIVRASFDAKGYEWLYAIAHTTTTGSPTNITVDLSYF